MQCYFFWNLFMKLKWCFAWWGFLWLVFMLFILFFFFELIPTFFDELSSLRLLLIFFYWFWWVLCLFYGLFFAADALVFWFAVFVFFVPCFESLIDFLKSSLIIEVIFFIYFFNGISIWYILFLLAFVPKFPDFSLFVFLLSNIFLPLNDIKHASKSLKLLLVHIWSNYAIYKLFLVLIQWSFSFWYLIDALLIIYYIFRLFFKRFLLQKMGWIQFNDHFHNIQSKLPNVFFLDGFQFC